MKKIKWAVSTMALLALAGNAWAENSVSQGTFGLTVSSHADTQISGKYFAAKDVAILAGFGFTNTSGTGGGTSTKFMAGFRKYLKTDDFAPFAGARYNHESIVGGTSLWRLSAEGGAEYFLAKHFSIEGSVSLGVGSTSTPVTSTTIIDTTSYAVAANLYF